MSSPPRIPCPAWSQARLAALDGGAVRPEGLDEHLLECPACAEALATDARLLGALGALEAPQAPAALDALVQGSVDGELRARRALASLELVPVPAELDDRVRREIDAEAQRLRAHRRWSLALGMAGAAAAVLVLARATGGAPAAGRHWSFEVTRGDGLQSLDPGVRALVEGMSGGALPGQGGEPR